MLPSFGRAEISEYEFLKLLVSTMVVHGYSTIFDNRELEKRLYNFYNDSQYKFLFKDVGWEYSKIDAESRVILDDAFQLAYAMGILVYLSGGRDVRSIINFSLEEAKVNIGSFSENQIKAMDSLCTKMKEKLVPSKPARIYVISKKENDLK